MSSTYPIQTGCKKKPLTQSRNKNRSCNLNCWHFVVLKKFWPTQGCKRVVIKYWHKVKSLRPNWVIRLNVFSGKSQLSHSASKVESHPWESRNTPSQWFSLKVTPNLRRCPPEKNLYACHFQGNPYGYKLIY